MNETDDGNRQRKRIMKAIIQNKWRLKCGLLYAGLDDNYASVLVAKDDALVFDGRDNEETKLRYYQVVTGYKFEVEVCAEQWG